MKQITQNILALSKKLMEIRSETSNREECLACLQYIQEKLEIWSEIITHNWVYSLIAKNFEWKRANVVLNGHVDVVPCRDEQWMPEVVWDKLYGRWSGDMKTWVAMIVLLFNKIIKNNPKKKYLLMLTSDEEVWGFDWVGYLCSQWWGWDVVLIPDGWATDSIVVASKWVLNIWITWKGKWSHASRPWLWDELYNEFTQFVSSVQVMIDTWSVETWRTTATVTELDLWHAMNAVPDSLKWSIDIRFTQEWSIDGLGDWLRTLVKKFPLLSVSIQWKGDLVYADEKKNPLIKKYLQVVEKNVWKAYAIKEDGSSDGRHFAKRGSTVILHRPTCENIHADDEWCSIEWMEKVFETYRDFIENLNNW